MKTVTVIGDTIYAIRDSPERITAMNVPLDWTAGDPPALSVSLDWTAGDPPAVSVRRAKKIYSVTVRSTDAV